MSEALTGRALDAAIATMLGHVVHDDRGGTISMGGAYPVAVPMYSADIGQAWGVVLHMHELGYCCDIGSGARPGVEWCAFFWLPKGREPHTSAFAATPQAAICQAALAALNAREATA